MKNFLVVAVVFWLLFLNGLSAVKQWTSSPIASTIVTGAQAALIPPTAVVSGAPTMRPWPTMPAYVVGAGVSVASSNGAAPAPQPAPTAAPVPTATSLPPAGAAVASVPAEVQAVYNALHVPPTPVVAGPPECNSQNATYRAGPLQVKTPSGLPIGEVSGWSCTSGDDAARQVQDRAVAMLDQYMAAHK